MQATNYPVSLPDSYVHFGKHKVFNRLSNKFDKHDLVRLWSLILNCKQVLEEEIVLEKEIVSEKNQIIED